MSLLRRFFAEFDTLRIVHDTINTNILSRQRKKSTKLVSFFQFNTIFSKKYTSYRAA